MFIHKEEVLPKRTINDCYAYKGPFEKAVDVAEHYGFNLVKPADFNEPEDIDQTCLHPLEKRYSLDQYKDQLSSWSHPVKVCYTLHGRRKNGIVKLEIFGVRGGIAEALLLRAGLAILADQGHKSLSIDLNSRGSRGASFAYLEALKNYTRKRMGNLTTCCADGVRTNPFTFFKCTDGNCHKIAEEAPRSIAYLTEDDRNHLMSIIEYLETMDTPYRINNFLTGHPETHPRTLFTITKHLKRSDKILARGERFDEVSEDGDRVIPAAALSLTLPGGKHESYRKVKPETMTQPRIYFAHIGYEAKRVALPLLEELRKRQVRVLQALVRDSLYQQMRHAEAMKVPYVVILGLQEVKEGAVIVRNMETQAQQSVPFRLLPTHLRRLVRTLEA